MDILPAEVFNVCGVFQYLLSSDVSVSGGGASDGL